MGSDPRAVDGNFGARSVTQVSRRNLVGTSKFIDLPHSVQLFHKSRTPEAVVDGYFLQPTSRLTSRTMTISTPKAELGGTVIDCLVYGSESHNLRYCPG